MHKQPAYSKYFFNKGQLANSEKLSSQVFSIPVHPYLNELEQEYIIDHLNKATKVL